jgi:hypothetical protein
LGEKCKQPVQSEEGLARAGLGYDIDILTAGKTLEVNKVRRFVVSVDTKKHAAVRIHTLRDRQALRKRL